MFVHYDDDEKQCCKLLFKRDRKYSVKISDHTVDIKNDSVFGWHVDFRKYTIGDSCNFKVGKF
jgi:hypothetical protein